MATRRTASFREELAQLLPRASRQTLEEIEKLHVRDINGLATMPVREVIGFEELLQSPRARKIYRTRHSENLIELDGNGRVLTGDRARYGAPGPRRYLSFRVLGQLVETPLCRVFNELDIVEGDITEAIQRFACVFDYLADRGYIDYGVIAPMIRVRLATAGPSIRHMLLTYPFGDKEPDEVNKRLGLGVRVMIGEGEIPDLWPENIEWVVR